MSFGDSRHEWNQHVVEQFRPAARPLRTDGAHEGQAIGCSLTIRPTREVTIPVYPKANLITVPPEESGDPAAEG